MDSGVYPGDDAALDTHLAAMEHLIDESEAVGLDASFPKAIKQLADRAVAAGRSKDSYAVLVEELRKR
ncbi:imine reductase family protein [Yinghuangia aomiensis]